MKLTFPVVNLEKFCQHDTMRRPQSINPGFLEFFAGSGLVAEALSRYFDVVWANDVCPKKGAIYTANHSPEVFHLGGIEHVAGSSLPPAALAWASFPCQDLSLAGNQLGLNGERSGLVWEWLRVIQELPSKPKVLVAENVEGLVSADGGKHYRTLHRVLNEHGYKAGALLLDAVNWVPQSRPRVFVIAVSKDADVSRFEVDTPEWPHTKPVTAAARGLCDWVWWHLPQPSQKRQELQEIVELDAPVDDLRRIERNLAQLPEQHRQRLHQEVQKGLVVAPGYKRTRNGKVVLELRFDNVAGCLRTPKGGSSRQLLVLNRNGRFVTRLLTIRETARLMGVRDTYKIAGSYNDGYRAMGDAIVVPAVRHLGKWLLRPLVDHLTSYLKNGCRVGAAASNIAH